MTTQILTSPAATRAEYSLSEAERLALLPTPKKLGESKQRKDVINKARVKTNSKEL